MTNAEVVFTRACSVASLIERLILATETSLDVALYRLNSSRLARALEDAARRGAHVRLVLDRGKYEETRATQVLLSGHSIPFRLLAGRQGSGTKMHHKFAILDHRTILTGSYNWTVESEEQNFENLVILREPAAIAAYQHEFEDLWGAASEARTS